METKNNTGLVVAVTILAMLVLGLVGFIVYDKVLREDGAVNGENNNVEQGEKNEEVSKIEVTDNLKKELRALIPTVKYCNQYLYKQYNGKVFKNTDLTSKDKTSDFNQCQGILGVDHAEYKYDSTNNEVYLYDYVLLYDPEGSDECQGCSYGKAYLNINIKYDDIELVGSGVSKESLKEYGQIYKYTFKLVDNNYEYISTEAIHE